jgi:hypothetical protein
MSTTINYNQFEMKKINYLLFIMTAFNACQKDALTVGENKSFREINVTPSSDPRFSNAMVVLLTPERNAGIALGGDAIYPATYSIRGKNLKIIDTGNGKTYNLKIVSETDLEYEGRILRLE